MSAERNLLREIQTIVAYIGQFKMKADCPRAICMIFGIKNLCKYKLKWWLNNLYAILLYLKTQVQFPTSTSWWLTTVPYLQLYRIQWPILDSLVTSTLMHNEAFPAPYTYTHHFNKRIHAIKHLCFSYTIGARPLRLKNQLWLIHQGPASLSWIIWGTFFFPESAHRSCTRYKKVPAFLLNWKQDLEMAELPTWH